MGPDSHRWHLDSSLSFLCSARGNPVTLFRFRERNLNNRFTPYEVLEWSVRAWYLSIGLELAAVKQAATETDLAENYKTTGRHSILHCNILCFPQGWTNHQHSVTVKGGEKMDYLHFNHKKIKKYVTYPKACQELDENLELPELLVAWLLLEAQIYPSLMKQVCMFRVSSAFLSLIILMLQCTKELVSLMLEYYFWCTGIYLSFVICCDKVISSAGLSWRGIVLQHGSQMQINCYNLFSCKMWCPLVITIINKPQNNWGSINVSSWQISVTRSPHN